MPFASDVPVHVGAQRAAPVAEGLPRQELPDAPEDAPRGRDVVEREVEAEGLPVDLPVHGGVFQDGLDLRSKEKGIAAAPVDKGLDADAVAAQDERPRPFVPHGEGEHALESPCAAYPFLLVEMNDDFAVRVGAEPVALALQFPAEFRVVVDLAVEDEPHGAVLVGQGLPARLGEVDDGEPPVAEPDRHPTFVPQEDPRRIGPPVGHDVRHASKDRLVDPAAVCRHRPADAAHALITLSSEFLLRSFSLSAKPGCDSMPRIFASRHWSGRSRTSRFPWPSCWTDRPGAQL